MTSVLILGVGGTGSRAVNLLQKKITRAGQTEEVKIVSVVFDTNAADEKNIDSATVISLSENATVGMVRNRLGAQCDDWFPRDHKYDENNLSIGHYFMPGAQEAVEALSKKYKLYITSNGTSKIQAGRLDSAAIGHFFQDIFISQDIGINKPDKGYFDRCFARIPGFDPNKTMIVGDSPSSDMLGGQNAGIATCWVNPTGRKYSLERLPDYEIQSLSQLESLLETL